MPDNDTATKESFLSSLAAIDNGAPEPVETPEPAETPEAPAKPAAPAPSPAVPAKDVTTAAVKTAIEPVKAPEAKKPEAPADAKAKSKWAQNEERKQKTWEQLNTEKAALQAEKDAIARQRQEIEAARNKAVADQPYRDEHGLSASDYRAVEKQLRAKGETDNADAAAQLADNIAKKEQTLRQQHAAKELVTKWDANLATLLKEHADLNDPTSDLAKETQNLLNTMPLLHRDPDGIKHAVQAAQIRIASRNVDGTKAENAQLKAQIEQLNKKLSIGGGAPTSPAPEPKGFDQMNQSERKKHLLEKLSAADRDAGFADD